MAAKRNAKENADETTVRPTATALPARGTGPLAGYPVTAGATHCRLHAVGEDGRIKEALTVGQSEDGPITRLPVSLLGDAALWDSITPGTRVRVVFTRYHGDQLKTKFGQGAIWVVPPRGETVDERRPTREEPLPKTPISEGQSMFLFLRSLQNEAQMQAEARAARELAALREMYATQAAMTRDYFAQMTAMFMGERQNERQDAARQRAAEDKRERRLAEAVGQAARTAVAEAVQSKADEDDEADDDDAPEVDAVEAALTGLTETLKPIAGEIGKRMAKGAIG